MVSSCAQKHGADMGFMACCQLSHIDSSSCHNLRENTDNITQISAETTPCLVLTAAVYVACCIFIPDALHVYLWDLSSEQYLHLVKHAYTLPPYCLKISISMSAHIANRWKLLNWDCFPKHFVHMCFNVSACAVFFFSSFFWQLSEELFII